LLSVMNRDYGEDVGSEETRSIESEDLAKDDVSDLFDETEEVRRPKEPGQLGNPRDLSASTGSVSMVDYVMLCTLLFTFSAIFSKKTKNYVILCLFVRKYVILCHPFYQWQAINYELGVGSAGPPS
jgi:hypothetical protein